MGKDGMAHAQLDQWFSKPAKPPQKVEAKAEAQPQAAPETQIKPAAETELVKHIKKERQPYPPVAPA